MNVKSNFFVIIKIIFITSVNGALSSENYYEGEGAERIIKSGIIQETIKEEDHKHLVIEYNNEIFWCTIEKNGNKVCELY